MPVKGQELIPTYSQWPVILNKMMSNFNKNLKLYEHRIKTLTRGGRNH